MPTARPHCRQVRASRAKPTGRRWPRTGKRTAGRAAYRATGFPAQPRRAAASGRIRWVLPSPRTASRRDADWYRSLNCLVARRRLARCECRAGMVNEFPGQDGRGAISGRNQRVRPAGCPHSVKDPRRTAAKACPVPSQSVSRLARRWRPKPHAIADLPRVLGCPNWVGAFTRGQRLRGILTSLRPTARHAAGRLALQPSGKAVGVTPDP
jgi:hypothetical protein